MRSRKRAAGCLGKLFPLPNLPECINILVLTMKTSLVHVQHAQNHMATTFRFVVSCAESASARASLALSEAHAEVARLEACLSEFRDSSPIHQLNQAKPGARVRLSPEGIELLERSHRFHALTRGAFDCAAKSLAKPSHGPAFAWDAASSEAWRLHPEVRIGFGAIGKGYALDRVRIILEQCGFRDYLLSAGGSSVILSGHAGPGDPWRWGWSWAKDADGDAQGLPITHWSGDPIAIGVSGTHEKGNHLLDARVGQVATAHARAMSSLVAAPSAADADALSTSLFVAGYEEGARFMAELPFAPAMAQIDSSGVPSWNGIFRHFWGSLDRNQAAPSQTRRPNTASSVAGKTALMLLGAVALGSVPARAGEDAKAALERTNQAMKAAAAALSAPNAAAEAPAAPAAADAPAATATAPVSASAPANAAAPAAPEAAAPAAAEDGAVDLGGMNANTFAPYVNERSPFWALLPLSALAIVLIHLKKNRRNPVKAATGSRPQSTPLSLILASAMLWASVEQAHAGDLVPMGKALVGVLGTPKAFKKTIGDSTFYYSKNAAASRQGRLHHQQQLAEQLRAYLDRRRRPRWQGHAGRGPGARLPARQARGRRKLPLSIRRQGPCRHVQAQG